MRLSAGLRWDLPCCLQRTRGPPSCIKHRPLNLVVSVDLESVKGWIRGAQHLSAQWRPRVE